MHQLLRSFTGAEEAAIRQITPLISIVRFPHGSLGSKGNTSCVWQQSKLNLILPNLPEECKFIVIRRKHKKRGKSDLKSTKFERFKIQRALELLSHTVEGVWKKTDKFNIEISNEKLQKWPEKGDLVELIPQCHIVKETEEEENEDEKKKGDKLFDADGQDKGPAPLQNSVIPDETFEGALNTEKETNVGGADAAMAEILADEVVNCIKYGKLSENKKLQHLNSQLYLKQKDLPT